VPDEIGGHGPPYKLADRVSLRVKRSNLIGREHAGSRLLRRVAPRNDSMPRVT
jgi:hypothetical protein